MDKETQSQDFITSPTEQPAASTADRIAALALKKVTARAKLEEIRPIVNTLLIRQRKYEDILKLVEQEMHDIQHGQLDFTDVF